MKRAENTPLRFESLSDVHSAFGVAKPLHPLISLISEATVREEMITPDGPHVLNFYKISYRPKFSGKLKYGQGYYDFDEGGLLFAAPGQIVGGNADEEIAGCSTFALLIHPDFLLGYSLAKRIKEYGFFSYSANEALHLSAKEKETIISIFKIIQDELNNKIDDFSQDVMVSQIALLLNYANRFYKRQFITRRAANNNLLQKLEELLDGYFNNDRSLTQGIPTVQYLSEQMNMSPGYLSDMLRSLTGQNAQQHIHEKLIEKAKEKLSTTRLTVSEVAYELGFEHPQSFSKLFKTKTNLSPLEFRRAFN